MTDFRSSPLPTDRLLAPRCFTIEHGQKQGHVAESSTSGVEGAARQAHWQELQAGCWLCAGAATEPQEAVNGLTPLRLVLIEWVDAFGCSPDWADLDDSRAEPLICRSVGWLLHDTPTCKVVVPHVTNTDDPTITPQGCGDMTIPSCAVTRMIDLREAG